MKISRQPVMFAASMVAVLALGACNKKEEAATPASVLVSAPAAVSVTSVNLGSAVDANNKVVAVNTRFTPYDTIYASVVTTGAGTAAFDVKWSYQDGQTVKEDSRTLNSAGPANTEFHISKPSGWPVGHYKLDVSLNGQAAASRDFSVQ